MRIILLLAFCALAATGQAQQTKLTGAVKDTMARKGLQHAVVTLLHQKDSTLIRFTRTDANGNFLFNGILPGPYILTASYPKFADFSDNIQVNAGNTDLGVVALTLKSKLMETVVVRSAGAVRIKGDTTEFTADSFAVREGATVEELLKKFPGFQVNSKGEITAQGRRVEKVLVDGEEFFGDDPTVATQNLSAKSVDKVQVYDNKSEQQSITGVSNGNEGKTINIKLKEDAKKGSFGKLNAGTDFDKLVDARGMYNRFRGKRKMSVYGTRSKVNTGSLNWEDQRSLGMEDDWEYDEISGFYTSFSENDGFNEWSLRGLPNSYTAGALYMDKWNEEKQALNGNYRYNRLGVVNNNSSMVQNILPEGITYRNQRGLDQNVNEQHNLSLKYEWKPDSLTSVKLTASGSRRSTEADSYISSEFIGTDGKTVNRSEQQRDQFSERLKLDNVLTWKQLFRKKHRQLITTLRLGQTTDDQRGVNKTSLRFFADNQPAGEGLVDQQRIFDGASTTYGAKATFIEPLNEKLSLVFDYAFNRNDAYSYRNSFNKSAEGKYELRDRLFSNNFDMKATAHSALALLRYTGKKFRFATGTGLATTVLALQNLDSNVAYRFRFLNLVPQSNLSYTIKPQQNLSLNYRGRTIQPSINQLQPLRDNNDPLREFIGNPDLRVGFSHDFFLSYNHNKVLKMQYMWVGINFILQDDAIAFNNVVDAQRGKQTYTPVNVDGNMNWNVWGQFGKGYGEKRWNLSSRLEGVGSRFVNFINNQRNVSENTRLVITPGLEYEISEKYALKLRPKFGYNWSRSSLQSFSNNYFVYGGEVEGMLMLPGKLRLSTDVNYDVQGNIAAFNSRLRIIRWNAELSKTVFKKNNGKVSLVANDILNQNFGYDRLVNSNFITESRYDRVAQYFLLRFEWNFTKMPGNK